MKKIVFLMGKNGAGKDDQKGKFLSVAGRKERYEEVAVGSILRKEVDGQTELGKVAKIYMDEGKLLPDELVNEMAVRNIMKSDKIGLLNGFPRTKGQLDYLLGKEIYPDMVIIFEVPDEEIVQRAKNRRVCKKCGETYTVSDYKPPKVPGKCDKCGSPLTTRADDKEEIVRKRFVEYEEKTAPVIATLRNMDIPIHVIDNTSSDDAKRQFEELMLSLL